MRLGLGEFPKGAHEDLRRAVSGKAKYPGRDSRETDRSRLQMVRQKKRAGDRLGQFSVLITLAPDRSGSMNDVLAGQLAPIGICGMLMVDRAKLGYPRIAFLLNNGAAPARNCYGHPASMPQLCVGGVHDHIGRDARDIALLDLQ